VVTDMPLMPTAQVHLPDAALSSSTQATILSGLVICEAINIRWVTAVEVFRVNSNNI